MTDRDRLTLARDKLDAALQAYRQLDASNWDHSMRSLGWALLELEACLGRPVTPTALFEEAKPCG